MVHLALMNYYTCTIHAALNHQDKGNTEGVLYTWKGIHLTTHTNMYIHHCVNNHAYHIGPVDNSNNYQDIITSLLVTHTSSPHKC